MHFTKSGSDYDWLLYGCDERVAFPLKIAGKTVTSSFQIVVQSTAGQKTYQLTGGIEIGDSYLNASLDLGAGWDVLKASWSIIGDPLEFRDIAKAFGFTLPSALAALTIDKLSLSFSLQTKDIIFSGVAGTGQTIGLNHLVNQLEGILHFDLLSGIPQINLQNLSITFNSEASTFSFSGEAVPSGKGSNDNAGHIHGLRAEVQIAPDSETGKSTFSGTLSGHLPIGSAEFSVRYTMGKLTQVFEGAWQGAEGVTLGISDLSDLFAAFDITIELPQLNPPHIGLDMKAVAFEYVVNTETISISAQTAGGEEVFLWAEKGTQGWTAVGGLELKDLGTLSNIPVIGGNLKSASLVVANKPVTNFSLPQLPTLPGSNGTPAVDPFSLGSAPISLVEGLNYAAVWNLGQTANSNTAIKNAQSLIGEDSLSVLVELGSPNTITAALSGGVSIPTGKSSDLLLQDAMLKLVIPKSGYPVTIELQGSMKIHIDGEFIDATATLAINEEEADVSVEISDNSPKSLVAPALLKGVHIDSFGIEMGVYFEPPGFDLGLTGKLYIGPQKPESGKLDSFAFFLEIIEEVPNPLLLAFNAQTIDLSEAITAVTNKPPPNSIPKVFNDISFKEVAFYWCDNVVVLPDGTTAMPGFRFHGTLDLFGFGIYGHFTSDANSLSGHAELAPIDLSVEDVPVFSLTGDGKGLKTKQEQLNGNWVAVDITQVTRPKNPQPATRTVYAVKPGGAAFELNAASGIHASAHVTLLGMLSRSIQLTMGNQGITFVYQESAAKITGIDLSCTLTCTQTNGVPAFSFSGSGSFQCLLKGTIGPLIPYLSFTRISLDAGLDGSLSVSITESGFDMTVDGNFEFEGATLPLPTLTINEPFGNIDELATDREQRIVHLQRLYR